jgi:hypothetical protein
MKTIDLKKERKPLFTASSKKPSILSVPAMNCLMVDGMGDPNGAQFQEAVGALYAVAYTMKFSFKKERSIDYPVMPLEGLWDAKDITDYARGKRENWEWTVFIGLPNVVTKKDVAHALAAAKEKARLPRFPEVRFERFAEGLSAQIMHVGPYAEEAPTIEALHRFVAEQGCTLRGRHHEIYLGDPRRSAPEKLKTIIRHPVARHG